LSHWDDEDTEAKAQALRELADYLAKRSGRSETDNHVELLRSVAKDVEALKRQEELNEAAGRALERGRKNDPPDPAEWADAYVEKFVGNDGADYTDKITPGDLVPCQSCGGNGRSGGGECRDCEGTGERYLCCGIEPSGECRCEADPYGWFDRRPKTLTGRLRRIARGAVDPIANGVVLGEAARRLEEV